MDIYDTLHPQSWGGYQTSLVVVMLNNNIQRDVAYGQLVNPDNYGDNSVEPLDGVGEKAVVITQPSLAVGYKHVIYAKRNALIYIDTTGDIANYAQRLEVRLSELGCRSSNKKNFFRYVLPSGKQPKRIMIVCLF